jgi:hypothetical protein
MAAAMQTAVTFQFPFIVLLRHGRGTIFNLEPSLPPSTSTLVAIQIPNPVVVLFPPLLLDDACGVVLDAAAAR